MTTATDIAKLLLSIKAVALNVKEPFRYTSGILSPIYCDNRVIISHPDQRNHVINAFLEIINEESLAFDVVAGTATAGIPHAAWIADRLNKPMVYVRSKAKGHGKQNQIEGSLEKGQKALVVEDLISTGGSAINAALALRDAGAIVDDCVAIFDYQLPISLQRFQEAKVQSHTLSNFPTLIETARNNKILTDDECDQALLWYQNPEAWEETTSKTT